jgi:CHAT domain-containing protein/Tfp pilus assembly protein PilF
MEAAVMAQKSLAGRARRLSINFRLGPILALSLAACPAVAQDRDQNHDLAAADRAFAEGARLRKEGKASLPRAIEKYQEALAIRRALGDRSGEAEALLQIGDAYNTLGDYRKSLEFWEQALPLKQGLGDRRGAADLLASMSGAYNNLGERRKAVECLWRTLTIKHELGDQWREANILLQIGVIYDDLGEKQKAIECLQQALLLFRKQGDKHAIATLLYRLGLTYDSIYERQKAVECFKEGLELRMAVRHPKGEGVTLNSLGNFYDGLGEKQKAIDHYARALPLLEAEKNYTSVGSVLRNLGLTYWSIGERRKALDFFKRAASLAALGDARRIHGRLLADMGKLLCEMEEYEQALEHLNRALVITRDSGEQFWEIHALHWMARAERGRGDLRAAHDRITEAIGKIESLRPTVDSPELRASAFSRAQEIYEFKIDTLMQLHKLRPAENYAAEALRVNEQARAREMLAMLAESRAEIRQGVEPELLARERSLRVRLDAQANRLTILLAGKRDEAQVEAARRELDALQTEYQQTQTQIRRVSPRYAALTEPQPLSLAEIQRQALDSDTLLLEYSLGGERSYLWAVTTNSMTSYELPGRGEIEQAARRVYDLLTSRNRWIRFETADEKKARVAQADAEYSQAAAALAKMVIGPVAERLTKKRLLIVSDGALQYAPFAALPAPARERGSGRAGELGTKRSSRLSLAPSLPRSFAPPLSFRPLIVDHEIVTLPSTSTLAVLRRELEGRTPAPKSLAALADPVFDRNDERFKAAFAASPAAPLGASFAKAMTKPGATTEARGAEIETESDLVRSARDIGVDGFSLARLPFTRKEAQAILALVPKRERLEALDFAASQLTVFKPELAQYRYVHIATHGFLNSLRPELSGIVLSLINDRGSEQDGFLRAHEVFDLRLPAEMVVLSGCQTGLGKEIKGEGLVSLTRGFMYAGAARVMVSLWEVNDQATSQLMARLYQGLLGKRQMSPAAALRKAQVSFWRDKRWSSPYYWAAFTLQGEPR